MEHWPNLLLGIEADIFALHQRNNASLSTPIDSSVCLTLRFDRCSDRSPVGGSASVNVQSSIDWIGTVRGRIGVLPSELTLLYVTGGFAYGKVNLSGNMQGSAILLLNPDFNWSGDNLFGSSTTKFGYALGGGVESKIASNSNWSWKLEYLYIDLGSIGTAPNTAFRNSLPFGITDIFGRVSTTTRFTENILRAGLNYTFDWGKAPVVVKY